MKLSKLLLTSSVITLMGAIASAQEASYNKFYSDSDNTGDEGLILYEAINNGGPTEFARITAEGIQLQGTITDRLDTTVNIGENLDVNGNVTTSGFVDVSGNLNVDGSVANAIGDFTVSDNLDVTGATDLNNGLNVDGSTTLDATTIVGVTNITGATTIVGTTAVTGATTINTTGTAASTIGTNGNATSILSTTVSIGNATNSTSISMGNTVSGTVISAAAGNTSTEMGDDRIRNTITDTNVSAGTVVANNGAARWVADENGKLNEVANTDTTSGTTAAMVVTNSAGNTHGIVVQEEKTVVSGGTSSSSLTLADNGATFSNSATGEPIQVHGVADGTADFDATNVRQVYSGLAAVLAATPELRLEPGKTGAGIGLGSYGGFHAVGFGLGHMYDNGAVLTVSAGKASHSKVAYKAGLSWSW